MKLIITLIISFSVLSVSAQTYKNEALRLKGEKLGLQNKRVQTNTKPHIDSEKKIQNESIDKLKWESSYVVRNIEAIDKENKHSTEELQEFNKEYDQELVINDIRISKDFEYLYFKDKRDDNKFIVSEIFVEDNTIKHLDCKTCKENYLIIENSKDYLVLETKPQDEEKYFTIRLILTK